MGIAASQNEVMQISDIIVLAMKPSGYPKVLLEIKPLLKAEQIIMTIAAGVTIAAVEQIIGSEAKIVRTMPNTPVSVLSGMTAMIPNKQITEAEQNHIENLLKSFGQVEKITEDMMHIFIATAGSMPAIVDMMVEALADGAVLNGMNRQMAYRVLGQAISGSVEMLRQSNIHPGVLKDAVCSPGGTTIAMVAAAEKGNLRSTLIETITACVEKSVEMSEKK
jgi:pyrroline-5-carboxylate reductase